MDPIMARSDYYCAYLMLFLCCVGIPGNALTMYIFSRKSMLKSSITVLLIGITVTDQLVLLFVLPGLAFPDIAKLHNYTEPVVDYIKMYSIPFANMWQTASVWIFSLICVERFLDVCYPLKVKFYCTKNRAVVSLVVIFPMAILYNLVGFWEFETGQCKHQNETSQVCRTENIILLLKSRKSYVYAYITAGTIVTHLVPCTLCIVLSIGFCSITDSNEKKEKALDVYRKIRASHRAYDCRNHRHFHSVILTFHSSKHFAID